MKYLLLPICAFLFACDHTPTSDDIQRDQQEQILKEGTSQVGMPGIKNFREKKMVKDVLEKRDSNFVTYAYIFVPMTGKFVFLGECLGYGIPYATEFTSPQKLDYRNDHGYYILPQADPNGLFSPSSADGTWLMMRNPETKAADVVYIEERVNVFPFKLPKEQTQ